MNLGIAFHTSKNLNLVITGSHSAPGCETRGTGRYHSFGKHLTREKTPLNTDYILLSIPNILTGEDLYYISIFSH